MTPAHFIPDFGWAIYKLEKVLVSSYTTATSCPLASFPLSSTTAGNSFLENKTQLQLLFLIRLLTAELFALYHWQNALIRMTFLSNCPFKILTAVLLDGAGAEAHSHRKLTQS